MSIIWFIESVHVWFWWSWVKQVMRLKWYGFIQTNNQLSMKPPGPFLLTEGLEISNFLNATWWRHQMETFYALLALCEGNPPVTDGFPPQRLLRRALLVFFICAGSNVAINNRYAGDITLVEIRSWMNDYIPYKSMDVIRHPRPNIGYKTTIRPGLCAYTPLAKRVSVDTWLPKWQ